MKTEESWHNQSIESLNKHNYGDPLTAPTALVRQCLEYVKIPIRKLSIEQLRLLIGQEIGLPYLIPLALEQLDKDILAEGDFYEGDLLKNVVSVNADFWNAYPGLCNSLKNLVKKEKEKLHQAGLDVSHFC